MKANRTSIILYGHDAHLLATRQWVLQSRGYQVFTAIETSRFSSLPVHLPVKLLVLCHSLSPQEAAAASALASSRWPGVKILALGANGSRTPAGLLGQLLHTMEGPAKLINVVNEIIGSSLPATGT